ncbi:MAG TPA: NAD(P) transhydrogenase subunit alpha [Chthoniobacterales bacterium]|jgi:NAD(P) transhydrogenase subunit alpha|nr:NAD(P) transhydrogenase subunit alpha [Chthoniobacterales bacterium]
MRIFVPKEVDPIETRVPLLPDIASKLAGLGAKVQVELGLGSGLNYSDADYERAGATISCDRIGSLKEADVVLRVRKPPWDEIDSLKEGCIHVSFLDPFNERELVQRLARAHVTAVSMEMIPRIAVAQKMDALSSQANLSGYVAVVLAAAVSDRIFPMLITPAGTIKPLRVFIIGVGVAGLQAIATARRLGASVEAFDTRPVVEEQVKSLGAKFVKVDLGETGEAAGGYAKALTPEQLQKQREEMARHVAQADVVITAAQVFGRKAPVIVTAEMIRQMKPGSVIVDTAIESGGNVECSKYNEETNVNGVKIIAFANLPGRVAAHASEMFSNNLGAFVDHFWDENTKGFRLDLTNPILRGCVITHAGRVCNEVIQKAYAPETAQPESLKSKIDYR